MKQGSDNCNARVGLPWAQRREAHVRGTAILADTAHGRDARATAGQRSGGSAVQGPRPFIRNDADRFKSARAHRWPFIRNDAIRFKSACAYRSCSADLRFKVRGFSALNAGMRIEGKWDAIDAQSAKPFLVLLANPREFPHARPLPVLGFVD